VSAASEGAAPRAGYTVGVSAGRPAGTETREVTMGSLRHRTAALAAAALLLAACGSDRSVTTATSPSTSGAPGPTTEPSATSDTSASTEPSSTTGPSTTSSPVDTTTPPDGGAWSPITYDDMPMPLAYPCCASNWGLAAPSPPLPAPGEPLADGVYAVEWTWPDDMSRPVVATVARFDRCNDLPAGSCQQQNTYLDSEYGVAEDTVEIELRFDASLTVILGGYVGFEYPDKSSTLQVGDGLALADLVTHLNADYQKGVVEPVLAGAEPWDVAAMLGAFPQHGFSLPLGDDPAMRQVVYTYLDAPPLLYQALLPYDVDPAEARGADVIGRIALLVEDGTYTVSVYAGWYS